MRGIETSSANDSGIGVHNALDLTPIDNTASITFKIITFSDGKSIALDPTDIVVLVGPNNAGKSVALRELDQHFSQAFVPTVITTVEFQEAGSPEDFDAFLKKHVRVNHFKYNDQEPRWQYEGYRFSFTINYDAKRDWPVSARKFGPLFCMRLPTETRITDSDPVDSIDFHKQLPSNPIQMLYCDDELEERISSYFRLAFREDLILFRSGGGKLPMLVGQRPIPEYQKGEDRISRSYISKVHDSTVPLMQQGDGMRSFASVILHMLAPITPSILLLDEPEAFLHPPQARLLGEIIATEKSPRAQLFLATHSSDVLKGLINVAPEHLRIVRMQRDGNVNRIRELDKEIVKKISLDPIMRYSSVLSGLFHERVIICEADADCMFYSSILDLPEVRGETHPDVLFVHANGKHRMATLAETLVALDVPVDIVADIDVLNDLTVLKRIVVALNGDWEQICPLADALKKEIENSEPPLSFDDLRTNIRSELDKAPAEHNPIKDLRSRIDDIFPQSTPWGAIKRGGKASLPQGQATQRFNRLQILCGAAGLWIVPVGELEGFCKSTGRKGPAWVQQVVEERDLATDPELEPARQFVKEIWDSKRSFAAGDVAHRSQLTTDA